MSQRRAQHAWSMVELHGFSSGIPAICTRICLLSGSGATKAVAIGRQGSTECVKNKQPPCSWWLIDMDTHTHTHRFRLKHTRWTIWTTLHRTDKAQLHKRSTNNKRIQFTSPITHAKIYGSAAQHSPKAKLQPETSRQWLSTALTDWA